MSDARVGERDIEGERSETASGSQATWGRTWLRASAIGLGVFAYFGVFTVWLPSKLLEVNSVATSDQWVQDVAVTASWSLPLVIGLVGLRRAQRRGWI